MEKLYHPDTWHSPEAARALAQAKFQEVCKEQYRSYLRLNKGSIDPEAKADYDERIKLGVGMIQYYARFIVPKYDNDLVPVKVEIEFEAPIKGPEGEYLYCKCGRCWRKYTAYYEQAPTNGWMGLPVTYGGRIDMLARDKEGRYWVFDWKTAARLSDPQSDYLKVDDQITSYCWALWSMGYPVAGFVYAEIKKALPEPPEPNKVQRLGRWYSVSKSQNTSPELYRETVEEGDPQGYAAGVYDEFLAYLTSPDGPKYHVRHQEGRDTVELRNAGYNIWLEAQDMIDPSLRLYPSPGRFGCNTCAYFEPCVQVNRGEDVDYTLKTLYEKRTKAYYEKESSTDSKGGR